MTQKKAVLLSVSYVMGTAVTYALMGALAGGYRRTATVLFPKNIWAIGAMTIVFVVMALSMFGLP
ncbi:MAG: hypothetical protein Q9M36_06660 [Sulfurovum sp.]|nr:hypothetical protein [Sulfurovum sp.]